MRIFERTLSKVQHTVIGVLKKAPESKYFHFVFFTDYNFLDVDECFSETMVLSQVLLPI